MCDRPKNKKTQGGSFGFGRGISKKMVNKKFISLLPLPLPLLSLLFPSSCFTQTSLALKRTPPFLSSPIPNTAIFSHTQPHRIILTIILVYLPLSPGLVLSLRAAVLFLFWVCSFLWVSSLSRFSISWSKTKKVVHKSLSISLDPVMLFHVAFLKKMFI